MQVYFRERRLALAWAGLAAVLAGPAPVLANAAFPDEFSVNFPPNAPHTILVGANFGLLVSTDDGASWRYSCEPYVTTGSTAPLSSFNVGHYDVTADGAVLAAAMNLTRSGDMGCTWPAATGASVSQPSVVSDIFADPNSPSLVLAIAQIGSGPDANKIGIVVSTDGGKTFGAPTYTTSNAMTGIEIARSTAFVAYASELSRDGQTAWLLRSTDSGASWVRMGDIPKTAGALPRIITIDPNDSGFVYVRLVDFPNDTVLAGNSANLPPTPILTAAGQLTAFLLAGDGSLYAGTGDGHFYAKHPGDAGFATKTGGPQFRCLGQRPGTSRIFACANFMSDGYSLGYSDDNGNTFTPLMKFTDLQGPLTCNPVPSACAAHWDRIQTVLCFGAGVAACQADAGGGSGQKPPSSGGSHCQSIGAGAFAALVLAVWMRRRSVRLARSSPAE